MLVVISEDKNINISYKIIVLINKLYLKVCQFYLKISSESLETYIALKDEEFLAIVDKLESYIKRIEEAIFDENVLGKMIKLKNYIFKMS